MKALVTGSSSGAEVVSFRAGVEKTGQGGWERRKKEVEETAVDGALESDTAKHLRGNPTQTEMGGA